MSDEHLHSFDVEIEIPLRPEDENARCLGCGKTALEIIKIRRTVSKDSGKGFLAAEAAQ